MWLRLLVGQFMQQAASQKMRSVVTDSFREQLQKQQADPDREPPAPCDVCFIFALNAESGPLTDLLENSEYAKGASFVERRGTLDGLTLVVAEVGVGAAAAAQGAADCIALHRPRVVVAAGFASGLQENMHKGHILMVEEIVNSAGETLTTGLKYDPASLSPSLHVGRLLTVERIIREPTEKAALAAKHNALACDMETFAVSQVCRALGVPFLAVRVISDAVQDRLPPEIEKLLSESSFVAKLGTAAGAIMNRFSAVGDLWQLYEDGLKCSQRLARFLRSMLPQLAARHTQAKD